MEDILPEAVLESLREHYYAGVMAAEIGYGHNSAKEDSVTGALGHSLLTLGIRLVQVDGHMYRWQAFHEVLSSQGPNTAEKEFGADGVFQLEVLDEAGHVVRRKALMFQAKKEWRGANKRLLEQAEDMVAYTPSAIVVDYRKSGFTGVAALDVIEAGGNRRFVLPERQKRLAEILGDEFVRCKRGTVGVFWNRETQALERDAGGRVERRLTVEHVMTTTVQQIR